MKKFVSLRDFDWVLLFFVLLICAVGVMQIYSATMSSRFADVHMHIKQIYWIAGGIAGMLLLSFINYEALLDSVHWMYIAAILSLGAVLAFGKVYGGGKRWIRLPAGIHFQPSEWVKLILILAMAKYFSDMRQRDASLSDIVKAGLLGGIPMLMVLVQPDLGTALTYVPILAMGLFLGGIQLKHAFAILLVGAALAVPAYKHLKPFQRARLTTFLDPAADTQGKGYQGEQSKIAVGAGGIWGKGLGKGSQTQNSFLPVPQTDFIFAAFSEEHGFIGAVGLLLLYFIVLMRLIHNAQTAPDRGGAIVILGVVAVLTFHILVNVGMVVGFMPVTGIPLPLMSYGGSSLLFTFLALGIVMNIRMRRFVN